MTHPAGCWDWQGTVDANGYGRFNGRYAHIQAHEDTFGPIADGFERDHLCRIPGCVNPLHMEVVTHAENMDRGMSPWTLNAAKTRCKHGHEFTPENTYTSPRGFRECRACNRDRQRQFKFAKTAEFGD